MEFSHVKTLFFIISRVLCMIKRICSWSTLLLCRKDLLLTANVHSANNLYDFILLANMPQRVLLCCHSQSLFSVQNISTLYITPSGHRTQDSPSPFLQRATGRTNYLFTNMGWVFDLSIYKSLINTFNFQWCLPKNNVPASSTSESSTDDQEIFSIMRDIVFKHNKVNYLCTVNGWIKYLRGCPS